jgi:hypothetical protein
MEGPEFRDPETVFFNSCVFLGPNNPTGKEML